MTTTIQCITRSSSSALISNFLSAGRTAPKENNRKTSVRNEWSDQKCTPIHPPIPSVETAPRPEKWDMRKRPVRGARQASLRATPPWLLTRARAAGGRWDACPRVQCTCSGRAPRGLAPLLCPFSLTRDSGGSGAAGGGRDERLRGGGGGGCHVLAPRPCRGVEERGEVRGMCTFFPSRPAFVAVARSGTGEGASDECRVMTRSIATCARASSAGQCWPVAGVHTPLQPFV